MTSINIIDWREIDISNYWKISTWKIFIIHIRVTNIKDIANKMIVNIQDKSWINNLDLIDKEAYTERMEPTVNKLVNDIFKNVEDDVTEDFWEYLVSHSAWESLNKLHSHIVIPLAELWKEQITWNPWFDFHTETSTELIAFWESKYRSNWNSYRDALEQISSFITNKKDIKELSDLRRFVSNNASDNAINWDKAYVAAFSINWTRYNQIFDNVLNSEYINPLLNYPEIYLIWVEVWQ